MKTECKTYRQRNLKKHRIRHQLTKRMLENET